VWVIWDIFSEIRGHLSTNSLLRKGQVEKRFLDLNLTWSIYFRNVWYMAPTLLVSKKNSRKLQKKSWPLSEWKMEFRFELIFILAPIANQQKVRLKNGFQIWTQQGLFTIETYEIYSKTKPTRLYLPYKG
jgi:hypothetical protein